MTIPPPPSPRLLLKQAGLSAKKSWGQNFLEDQTVLSQIAHSLECAKGDPVLELGAGTGALTYHLLSAGYQVTAVERDWEIIPLLKEAMGWSKNLTLIEGDIAKLDYKELAKHCGGGLNIIGNLPYQLSGRILVSLSDVAESVQQIVVMVQKEVAKRIVADPTGKTYGLLSVLCQRNYDASLLFEVPPQAFFPPPKVDSAVVHLRLKKERLPLLQDQDLVLTARAAFSQRRKTVLNALSAYLKNPKEEVRIALEQSDIDPKARAETLSVARLNQLAQSLRAANLLPEQLTMVHHNI